MSLLESSEPAINCAGKKNAEEWLRHNNSSENEGAAEGKIDQSGSKSAPIIRQPFADQKGEHDGADNRQRDGDTRGRGVNAEKFVAGNDEPVEQRRFLQTRNAVVRRQQVLAAMNHFARGGGVLAFSFAVKIADADGTEMDERRQCDQNGKEGVSRGRRW